MAAAKREGKVVVAGGPGNIYRDAALAFQKAFPDIQIEFTGASGRDFGPKVLAERGGGQYLWDVYLGGATTGLTVLRPEGALDPLRPVLLLPDVLDSSKWLGGFEDPWMDKERRWAFAFEGRLMPVAYVDRAVVPESELSTIDQLLDPKWKGKIISGDYSTTGSASAQGQHLLIDKGEAWFRKFLAQDLVLNKDERLVVEALVRGRYPIATGVSSSEFGTFQREGLGATVKVLDPDSASGGILTGGFGMAMLMNRAPHPNAAKVYINWLLSQEGQKAYVAATSLNSRRLDVTGPAETAPKPTVKYRDVNKEEFLSYKQQSLDIAKQELNK